MDWAIPYRSAEPGAPARPNLWLHLTGPNGRSGNVLGIVDSGADRTSLPIGYASLMGYTTANLERQTATTAGGETSVFVARDPVSAYVTGLPQVRFHLWPMFTRESTMVLWGRADFFMEFGVMFDEAAQEFTLIVDE